MTNRTITREDLSIDVSLHGSRIPGLLVIFQKNEPRFECHTVPGAGLRIGRNAGDVPLADDLLSRAHAEVAYSRSWIVRDLGSKNGTFVNGAKLSSGKTEADGAVLHDVPPPRILRIGRTVCLLVDDIATFQSAGVADRQGAILGPTLAAVYQDIESLAPHSETLLITGPSGSGKELAARAFHNASGRANAPFIPVNCAAIPEGLAERLLFGAKRGAYSGSTSDSQGYVQAASGGTLFLDELAELDLQVQAKLLRVIESKRVMPLGDSQSYPVDLRICAATHANLRENVASKRFRDDLYYRIGQPEISIPPLSQRREEIPFLIGSALTEVNASLSAHALLIEVCMMRDWPGNVRELRREAQTAGRKALSDGSEVVHPRYLNPTAGTSVSGTSTAIATPPDRKPVRSQMPTREEIEAVLEREGGNVSATARALNAHRNQLVRWMDRLGINRPGNDPGP